MKATMANRQNPTRMESRLCLSRGGSGGVKADSSVSTGAAVADSVEWSSTGSDAEPRGLFGFLGAETKSSMLTSRGTRSGYQYEGGRFFCKHARGWDRVEPLSIARGRTGLKSRNDNGFSDHGGVGLFCFCVALKHLFEELGDGAFWSVGMTQFGLRGEDA